MEKSLKTEKTLIICCLYPWSLLIALTYLKQRLKFTMFFKTKKSTNATLHTEP